MAGQRHAARPFTPPCGDSGFQLSKLCTKLQQRVAVNDENGATLLHGVVFSFAVLLGTLTFSSLSPPLLASLPADWSTYFSNEFVIKPAPESALLLYKFGRLREDHDDLQGAIEAYEHAKTIHLAEKSLESTDGIRLLQRIAAAKHGFDEDPTSELDAMIAMLRKHKNTAVGDRLLGACDGLEEALLFAATEIEATLGWRAEMDILTRVTDLLEVRGTLMTSDIGSRVLVRIGVTSSNKGHDYGTAYEAYVLALQIYEEGNVRDMNMFFVLLQNIALCLGRLGDTKGELHYMEKAIQIADEEGNRSSISTVAFGQLLFQHCRLLINSGEIQRARASWVKALGVFENAPKSGYVLTYRSSMGFHIGELMHEKGDLAWALEAYKLTEQLLAQSHPNDEDNVSPRLVRAMRIANVQARQLSAGQQSRLAAKLNSKFTLCEERCPMLQAFMEW
eukprot:TRINITY_DN3442_c0_g3_i1.p1 TRINITY_DN3442_c0_g3~~TRINITY_DN3442_c0_g3_i1.p1  ORF type:complete len:462 (-),score=53.66 TRINITY_DN3442_c0_g3_i1:81-1427(-)